MSLLPEYYFRLRENGATVFRVRENERSQRIEMEQIAVVKMRNGDIKPSAQATLTAADNEAIGKWIETRRRSLERRVREDVDLTVERLNQTAHWAQTRATEAELDEVADVLLLAMHDLRSVLVRKKSDQIARQSKS